MNFEDIIVWIKIGQALFNQGADAYKRIREALAAESIDPELLSSLDDLYTARIERARGAAEGR